jgi:hypothetical protein
LSDILTAVMTDGLPAVEAACAEAIAQGVHSADVVLNIQSRSTSGHPHPSRADPAPCPHCRLCPLRQPQETHLMERTALGSFFWHKVEELDEMLTVVRFKLPMPLRRSLACTNAIENMMGTVRRVSRNVKCWAQCRDGVALDGRRYDGSHQGLPPIESPQVPASAHSRIGGSSIQVRHSAS